MSSLRKIIFILLVALVTSCSSTRQLITIWSIGDSTMADKRAEVRPETGWCQALPGFLAENVTLQKLTAKVIGDMGADESKKMFLWTSPDNKFPEGRKDDTHLCVEGARMVAGLAAKELKRQHIPLIRRKPGQVVN